MIYWVIVKSGELLFLACICLTPTPEIFQLYHGEKKLIFNEMMMRSALN